MPIVVFVSALRPAFREGYTALPSTTPCAFHPRLRSPCAANSSAPLAASAITSKTVVERGRNVHFVFVLLTTRVPLAGEMAYNSQLTSRLGRSPSVHTSRLHSCRGVQRRAAFAPGGSRGHCLLRLQLEIVPGQAPAAAPLSTQSRPLSISHN
uniref:Uncharacterized protein n=1 Tax=Mycena chlorophos TaxID=658473 RepID=A0ABQ0L577_MYCCL|nr:predicted protein [Mycena chlorophos]